MKDSSQTPSVDITEAQNAVRRAAKARQRRNRTSGTVKAVVPLFDAVQEDKKSLAEEAKVARATRAFEFDTRHAGLALTHKAVTDLRAGSLGRRVAIEALSFYPLVKASGDKKRSEVAVETALTGFTAQELRLQNEIKFASRSIKIALASTFIEAKSAESELVNT